MKDERRVGPFPLMPAAMERTLPFLKGMIIGSKRVF
jgi:hypothetical protein